MASDFKPLISRMAASGIAKASDLVGCSSEEIAVIEHRYGIVLPNSYRRYLELMGHQSGLLFASDHMAVSYRHVLAMTEDIQTRRVNPSIELCVGDTRAPSNFRLPPKAFLIAGRLDAAWQYIQCTSINDSPVWHFDENDWTIRETDASVLDWLGTWCGITEQAIESGYFKQYPKGTEP